MFFVILQCIVILMATMIRVDIVTVAMTTVAIAPFLMNTAAATITWLPLLLTPKYKY